MSTKVFQRKLELLGLSTEQDLDGNGRVQCDGHGSTRHDGRAGEAVRYTEVVGEVKRETAVLQSRSRDGQREGERGRCSSRRLFGRCS